MQDVFYAVKIACSMRVITFTVSDKNALKYIQTLYSVKTCFNRKFLISSCSPWRKNSFARAPYHVFFWVFCFVFVDDISVVFFLYIV